MTLCRRDAPALLAVFVLLVLFALAVSARAQGNVLLQEVAKEAAQQVAAPGWLSLAGNITVAGILLYYSRQFYADKKELETKLLAITERFATLAANYELLARDIRGAGNFSHSQKINS